MEIPRHWRLKQQRYALIGEVCPHCEGKIFPPRDVCPHCGGEARNPYPLNDREELFAMPVLHSTPANYEVRTP